MDSTLSPEERKMQEEILQHEFPFDEKAWTDMDALLDRNKQKPEAGTPPAPKDNIPGPSWKLGLLVILLSTCSIGAASLYWLNLKSRPIIPTNASILPSKSKENTMESGVAQVAPPAMESGITQPENTQDNTHAFATASTAATNKNLPLKRGASSKQASEQTLLATTGLSGSPLEKLDRGSYPPNVSNNNAGPSASKSGNEQTLLLEQTARNPGLTLETTSETKLVEITQIDPALLPIPALEKVAYVQPYLQPDSIIHPVKRNLVITARQEQGWILGVNANTVDNNPVRLSVLPHVGFFKSYRLKPGLTLQADLMLKYVSGYQWHVEFIDIIPGGSSQNIVHINNILYLELPIFLKYQYNPKCSMIGGLKPSGNVKLFGSGLNSQSGDSGGRYLDGQTSTRYFDLGLVFGWEWRFSRHWALDIRYNQGLMDLTHDPFFKDSSTHLNSDLQVSMRYSLSKKIRRHAPKALFPPSVGQ